MTRSILFLFAITVSCLMAVVVKLTPEEFIVKAGVARYWKFNVTGSSARVMGEFRASGGAHNDIRVVITDSDECENYINGNATNVFYNSGPKTVGKLDVNLGRASYCIIFDNRNSIISAKEVATRISLIPE